MPDGINWSLDDKELQRLLVEMPDQVDEAIRATAFEVQGVAQGLIQSQNAIDTGATLNSGFTRTSRGNDFSKASGNAARKNPGAEMIDATPGAPKKGTAYISFATNYAIWIELGTSRMGARPFLGPATEKADDLFMKHIRKIYNE
jgi:hypothetical protein